MEKEKEKGVEDASKEETEVIIERQGQEIALSIQILLSERLWYGYDVRYVHTSYVIYRWNNNIFFKI
jgi:hypothetical protein